MLGNAIAKSNTSATALLTLNSYFGTAASFLGFAQMLIAGFITIIMRVCSGNSLTLLAINFFALTSICIVLALLNIRKI